MMRLVKTIMHTVVRKDKENQTSLIEDMKNKITKLNEENLDLKRKLTRYPKT